MGAVVATVRAAVQAADQAQVDMAKETLRQLEATAEFIAEGFRLQVTDELKNPDPFTKWKVTGGRQDREHTLIRAMTVNQPATAITDAVDDVSATLFQLVDGNSSDAGKKFLGAMSGIVKGALNVFLGNTNAGVAKVSRFLIIPHGVTFYRVDIKGYRYNLESKGFTDTFQGVMVVYSSRAILQIDNLRVEELLSYVSDMMQGDKVAIKAWIENYKELMDLAKTLAPEKPIPKSLPNNNESEATFALQANGESNGHTSSKPSAFTPRLAFSRAIDTGSNHKDLLWGYAPSTLEDEDVEDDDHQQQ